MSQLSEQLSQCSLFNGLSPNDLQHLADIAHPWHADKGQNLFVEGDAAQGFYLVLSGQVKIYKSNAEGKEKILYICNSGETFAEVPVFHGTPYPASASATQECQLLSFPRDRFVEMIAGNPSLSLNMMPISP